MGNEVLEDLDGGYPRLSFIGYPCFSTDTHDHLVVVHAIDKVSKRGRVDFGVGIHLENILDIGPNTEMCTYHEAYFKEVWRDSHKDMDLAEKIEVKWRHAIVVGDTREEVHEDKLTVTFASVARLLLFCSLLLCATLDDNDCRCSTSSNGCRVVNIVS